MGQGVGWTWRYRWKWERSGTKLGSQETTGEGTGKAFEDRRAWFGDGSRTVQGWCADLEQERNCEGIGSIGKVQHRQEGKREEEGWRQEMIIGRMEGDT